MTRGESTDGERWMCNFNSGSDMGEKKRVSTTPFKSSGVALGM